LKLPAKLSHRGQSNISSFEENKIEESEKMGMVSVNEDNED